ncbi:MAG: hypothetical protein JXR38_01925 [Bacilli bacterium]|nr:hypothetical protein [Bacilli bacterium]
MWPYITVAVALLGAGAAYYCHLRGVKIGEKKILDLFLKAGYDAKIGAFKAENKDVEPSGIVFLGDSITQDFPLKNFFPDKNVINRGIGGGTTVGVLKRLDISVYNLEPKAVIILIGTNDFGVLNAKAEIIVERIDQIIKAIKERLPKTKIYLEAVYPVNPNINPTSVSVRNNRAIQALNAHLAGLSDVTWLDYTEALIDTSGNLDPKYTYDGLHLNQAGYEVVASRLKQDVELLSGQ